MQIDAPVLEGLLQLKSATADIAEIFAQQTEH